MEVAEENLVVDIHTSLVALRLVMGVSFGVGIRAPVTTKRCVENDTQHVGREGGGLNCL